MDKFPLLWNGRAVGELTTERQELYTWFTARCRLPERGLWCAWAVGDQREVKGVLTRKEAGIRYLAVPYDPKRPFLLTRIFCFARIRRVKGQAYAIFTFDGEELPVFS